MERVTIEWRGIIIAGGCRWWRCRPRVSARGCSAPSTAAGSVLLLVLLLIGGQWDYRVFEP